jgi:hypothetical protein
VVIGISAEFATNYETVPKSTLTRYKECATLTTMIKNHIITNNYTRQENFGSPMAVLNGANGRTGVRQHRQCIFDFQGK